MRQDVGDDADDAVGDAFARRNCHETVRQDVGDDADDAVGDDDFSTWTSIRNIYTKGFVLQHSR